MKNWIVRRITSRAAWLLLVLPLTGGCASGLKKFEWTEDVKLMDGRQIVVKRMTEFRARMSAGDGFKRGWLFNNASLSADLPAPVSRKVEWNGRGLSPFILDVMSDGRVYLVCSVQTGEGSNIWKVPQHEYFVSFRLEGEQWHRIALSDLPPEIKRANLLTMIDTVFIYPSTWDPPSKHIDLKRKQEVATQYAREPRSREIVVYPPRPTH